MPEADAVLEASQSHPTDLVSSDVLFFVYGIKALSLSRNPTVLSWPAPTGCGSSEPAGNQSVRRNPTILIWSVPTRSFTTL